MSANDSGGTAVVATGGGPALGALRTAILSEGSGGPAQVAAGGGPHVGAGEDSLGTDLVDASGETPTELRKVLDVNPVGESTRVSKVMIEVTGEKAKDASGETPTELRKVLDVNPVGESTSVSKVMIEVTGEKAKGESTSLSKVMIEVTGEKAMEPGGSSSRRIPQMKKMKPEETFGFGNLNWGVKAFKQKTPEERDLENRAILAKSGRVHSDELKTFDGAPAEMIEELNRRGRQAVANSLNQVYNKYRNASFLKREIEVMLLTGGRGSKGHLQAQRELEIIQRELDPLIMDVRSVFPKFSAPPHLLIEPFVEPKTPKK